MEETQHLTTEIVLQESNTSLDKIRASYTDTTITLSPKNEGVKKRWVSAHSLRLNWHSKEQTALKQMELFGLSKAQAYRDVSNAEKLFGSVSKSNKDGLRVIHYEYAHKCFQMAVKDKDLNAQHKFLELMDRFGGGTETDINFNPEKFENKQDKFSVAKEVENAIVKHLRIGVLDFNTLEIEDAVIIEENEQV